MTGKHPEIEAQHRQLTELFQQHRLTLFAGELGKALQQLQNLRQVQAAHITQEETELLPRLDTDARWPAKVYLAEHRKLEVMLARLMGELKDLPGKTRDATLILSLLEREMPFKHVLEHHFEREEKALLREC